jgi:hypothetical protein
LDGYAVGAGVDDTALTVSTENQVAAGDYILAVHDAAGRCCLLVSV